MQKGIIAAIVVILLVGSYAFTSAQRGPGGPGRPMMGQGPMGPRWQQGPGMGMSDQTVGPRGQMGPGADMRENVGPGMMRHMGLGMGMMGPGMMGMMGSPEIMGSMMSIRGEMMSVMGQMMQRYGNAIWQITPEVQQKMQKEMMERLGEILTKYGTSLKERAKAVGK